MSASSCGVPTFLSGLRFWAPSIFSGVLRNFTHNGVWVSDGAMQLKRMSGAYSAASERVRASLAPLAMAIEA